MPNASLMSTQEPLRVLVMGAPGSGKTGSLCSLIDAGYKLRVLDYDGNFRSVLEYANPAMLKNVDVCTLEDKLAMGPEMIEAKGVPTAYANGVKLMKQWKYTYEGQEYDLGPSTEWGGDTIVVLDTLTTMGDAGMRRALSIGNRTMSTRRDKDWGVAMAMQENFLDLMRAKSNKFHLIVFAHTRVISPKESRQGDDNITKSIKEELADMIPTRIYPSALGRELPPKIAGKFDTVLLSERQVKAGGASNRVLRTNVGAEMDVKMPSGKVPAVLPQATGLLELFKATVPWSIPKLENANV